MLTPRASSLPYLRSARRSGPRPPVPRRRAGRAWRRRGLDRGGTERIVWLRSAWRTQTRRASNYAPIQFAAGTPRWCTVRRGSADLPPRLGRIRTSTLAPRGRRAPPGRVRDPASRRASGSPRRSGTRPSTRDGKPARPRPRTLRSRSAREAHCARSGGTADPAARPEITEGTGTGPGACAGRAWATGGPRRGSRGRARREARRSRAPGYGPCGDESAGGRCGLSGPGAASDPRVPQSVTFTSGFLPEDPHGSEQAGALALEGKRGGPDLLRDAVETFDPERLVGGPMLVECDAERECFNRHRGAVLGDRGEEAEPLPHRHLTALVISTAEQLLGGFVVEEQISGRVHQEDRHGQGAGELPHQDELDRLLGHEDPPPRSGHACSAGHGRVPPGAGATSRPYRARPAESNELGG